jgi:hypothetical protein
MINAEVIRQSETDSVGLSLICELLAETDEHAVEPA